MSYDTLFVNYNRFFFLSFALYFFSRLRLYMECLLCVHDPIRKRIVRNLITYNQPHNLIDTRTYTLILCVNCQHCCRLRWLVSTYSKRFDLAASILVWPVYLSLELSQRSPVYDVWHQYTGRDYLVFGDFRLWSKRCHFLELLAGLLAGSASTTARLPDGGGRHVQRTRRERVVVGAPRRKLSAAIQKLLQQKLRSRKNSRLSQNRN